MKKDIMVIRESIGRVVSMLTLQKITVTQRGSRAFVKYHPKTGDIMELNIPFIPDDASDEFIAAIQGFLDHEVGHVLFSDFDALKNANKEGKRVANLANLVEDVYVERKMAEAFKGSGANLESVRKFYLEKIARPKIDAALKAGNIEEAQGYATVAAFRAWGGQTSAADFIKEPKIAALVAPVTEKVGPELMEALRHTKNSMDCLDLARKFKKALEKPKAPPPPPPEEEKPPSPPSEGGDAGDEPDDEGEKADAEDKGSSKTESDDSGKEREEEAELDPLKDATDAGAEGGKDASDKEDAAEPEADKDDEPVKGDDTEAGEPEASDTPTDPDSKDGGFGSDEKTEDDAADEPEDGDSSDGADAGEPEPDEAGSAGGDTAGDEESGGEEGASATADDAPDAEAKPAEKGEPDETESGDSDTPAAPPEPDPLAEMFDIERDFDKDMSERLSKDAKGELASSDYAVFSNEWDKIEPAPLSKGVKTVEKLDEKLRDKVGVMQKSLERAMAAQSRKTWNPGQRRGRVAPGSLFKTSVGDDRVFRTRYETQAKNTAVSLVVDCSGSMERGRIELAGVATYALATVLERLKINYEAIGFTAYGSSEMLQLLKDDAHYHGKDIYSMGWGRIEPLYMPVFKPFNGRLDTQARSRIAHLTEGPSWLHENIDGECVQIAGRRLLQQRAERHVMIVLSDGSPSCSAGRNLNSHLKKTVKGLTGQGVEMIGIGIQTEAVKMFYPKNVVVNSVEELPTRVMAELTKLLLAP